MKNWPKKSPYLHIHLLNLIQLPANQAAVHYVYIGIGILALIVAAVVGFIFSRRRKTAEAQALAEMAVSTKAEFPTLDFDQVGNDSQVRKQLEQLAKKKPDEFVNLLRTWLVDE